MKYRTLSPLTQPVSALGFGAMRLPTIPEDSKKVDEAQSIEMIRYAVDHGVNYVDTAYPYHGGVSETIIGKALQEGYRERVYIADKLPIWKVEDRKDVRRFLGIQLERLQTGFIDLYLIHALTEERWEKTKQLGVMEELEKAKREGLIGHIGFSFHDAYPVFVKILEEYDSWEFCQIQYNYMDVDYQAGRKGMKRAREKGLGVVIMEPLKGGQLAATPPPSVAQVWETEAGKASKAVPDPVRSALRWLWDQEDVGTVLSGMSTLEQLKENIESAEFGFPGNMSEDERRTVVKVREAYNDLSLVGCTGCGYCLPCPEGVNIPRILEIYNDVHKYGDLHQPKRVYWDVLEPSERADNCTECGTCEEACPQNISIIEELAKAHEVLSR
ncbi:MAG: aldo/keto reductase [Spirochaetaceae bacterium]